jgi:hypothetical protein
MNRYLAGLLLFSSLVVANDKFAKNIECKSCHNQIYQEYQTSMHSQSTIYRDEIHSKIWDIHPQNIKKEQYKCGQCHTPADENLKNIQDGKKFMPNKESQTHNEAISCAYCHRIESIEQHKIANKNIISKEEKKYFGNLKDAVHSPFHKTDSTNQNFKNGNVCIGCHSHKMNKHGMNICSTNIKNELDEANCVSCHMPKVLGSVSDLHNTTTHSFHGFPGVHNHQELLAKYVDISILKNISNFEISVDNKSSHSLLLHPLRVAKLKVKVKRDGKVFKEFDDKAFVKAIGSNGKPTPPWLATEVVKDTMIKHNEKRVLKYDFKLQPKDEVVVTLGYFLVNPKALKALNLQNSKIAKKFHILKREKFKIE